LRKEPNKTQIAKMRIILNIR